MRQPSLVCNATPELSWWSSMMMVMTDFASQLWGSVQLGAGSGDYDEPGGAKRPAPDCVCTVH